MHIGLKRRMVGNSAGFVLPKVFISDVATSVSEWKCLHSLTLVATAQPSRC
jgi:hypothetical protein